MCKICKSNTAAIFVFCEPKAKLGRVFNLFLPKHIIMHHLYSMCILYALSIGYIHNVKAYPTGGIQCGIVERRKPRIINGTVAEVDQFPWIASIRKNGRHICGGSIISGRYILSAAHCFDEVLENYKWSVVLGEHNQAKEEMLSTNFAISKVIKHEQYRKKDELKHDIVLLELSENIKWSEHIQPICLPKEDTESSNNAIAAGWGPDDYLSANENNKLRFIKIDIFGNNECNDIYKKERAFMSVDKTQMCAGKVNNEIQDTSRGDSGGPLLVNIEGKRVLVGITSRSANSDIFPRAPSIYVRVFKYMNWIMKHVGEITYYYPPVLANSL